jgi:hypothetical protein
MLLTRLTTHRLGFSWADLDNQYLAASNMAFPDAKAVRWRLGVTELEGGSK